MGLKGRGAQRGGDPLPAPFLSTAGRAGERRYFFFAVFLTAFFTTFFTAFLTAFFATFFFATFFFAAGFAAFLGAHAAIDGTPFLGSIHAAFRRSIRIAGYEAARLVRSTGVRRSDVVPRTRAARILCTRPAARKKNRLWTVRQSLQKRILQTDWRPGIG